MDVKLELDTSYNERQNNDLATAVNSVALVGELKTPSLPSSIHIPFIMPSQSLLLSRDEVFKEIKYLGEDVAISSLHLFQGDMDLSPLSFNASLEEQWVGEEEPEGIETVLKVVPPAYHQYLNLFSKVKGEKLPAHRACDHHIELEGLLPQEALSQVQILKEAFTTAPILSHFNPFLPTVVETDASDYSLGAVMSQVNDSGKNTIEFDYCKLLPAELNYEFHDKELLGIVWASSARGLFFFLFPILARQTELLAEFHFTVACHPGRLATLPDAFSHWKDMYPERGVDFISRNPQNFQQVLKKDGIQESRFFSIKAEIFSYLFDHIQKEVWQD
ncbi:hypothetical protein O181_016930 [Austropuccinia psidii MF-1]|uniref:Reverse transcriptase/retrotransposon-derived protein RNase H-like domain-containing protein n=1 Tax=Austropuccinia psidii MF-1 TaxID=1389203 RepID=A0A9Q3C5V4_9BASI|nr:hypothetical protein [Austropuccinia psidii MF-1]